MMFLTVKKDVHVGGGHGLPCGPRMQCTTKPLMYQHLLLLTLFIMVLCTPGSLGSTNRVAVQEQGRGVGSLHSVWSDILRLYSH